MTRKVKQMKNKGKDTEDLDNEEENYDLYNEIGQPIRPQEIKFAKKFCYIIQ